ncbi:hypothetical protein HAX54_047763, partial [Datura stramonium]|nr:hypothetical protein [Datura stramonium]
ETSHKNIKNMYESEEGLRATSAQHCMDLCNVQAWLHTEIHTLRGRIKKWSLGQSKPPTSRLVLNAA